jgi:hypothetical protein
MIKNKRKFQGFEKQDGTIFSTGFLDGYEFGDTLLEQVPFKFEVNENRILSVSIKKCEYTKTLNIKKWEKIAIQYAEKGDCEFIDNESLVGESLVLLGVL